METFSPVLDKYDVLSKEEVHRYIPIALQAVIYLFTFALFKVCARFTVRGLENLRDLPTGAIFAANHSSEWDGVLLRTALPFFSPIFSPMYYVSMKKNEYVASGWRNYIYGGFIFKLLGAYPRYSGKKNYAYALQHHIAILEKGRSLCIFPEGRRTTDGTFGEAHGGVAFLAHATGRPIVPTGVSGMVRFSFLELITRRRTVVINFGKIIRLKQDALPDPETCKSEGAAIMEEVKKLVMSSS